MEYVLGFRVRGRTSTHPQVALIRKVKPTWQAGKLNGVGGKVEEYDAGLVNAMVREFREETGVMTDVKEWRRFGRLQHGSSIIHLYESDALKGEQLQTTTAEPVGWYYVEQLSSLNTMGNLAWLVPLALDKDKVTATIIDNSEVSA